jgi:hypothetical protein
MKSSGTAALVLCALCAVSSHARADAPTRDPDLTPPLTPGDADTTPPVVHVQREWYGWQTLVADAVLPVVGAPIVHGVHKNVGRAVLSLGARILVPMVFFYAGFASARLLPQCQGDGCEFGEAFGMGAGFAFAGYAGVALADAALFAWDETEVRAARFGPAFAVRKDGATLGLIGSF